MSKKRHVSVYDLIPVWCISSCVVTTFSAV